MRITCELLRNNRLRTLTKVLVVTEIGGTVQTPVDTCPCSKTVGVTLRDSIGQLFANKLPTHYLFMYTHRIRSPFVFRQLYKSKRFYRSFRV